ncbi:carbonic anhydrase family protein [Kordiimonas sp. SCSIO 12603]|uniref:carbonic anhydrase n=1 Tax=Kordiimonas sp. SCSIO 12603 TaxID=2829596 RepID=UPI002104E457|nr:carbonic anhydrase family protein [Kordiimonas sp. SCSIO 12603]UTW58604.1 carbonic anhydrase family protein [Kordiimonas sp. SCSIO 12603]
MKKHVTAALCAGLLASTAIAADDDWGYGANDGPAKWGDLNPTYAACSLGTLQSPIDLEGTEPVAMHRLRTHYDVSGVNMRNAEHTITATYDMGNMLHVGPKSFMLKNFKFHTPSEHTVSGERFPMEIQFMHESANGTPAIVSVLVKEGSENKAAKELWNYLPLEPGQSSKNDKIYINARDFMPQDKSYYRYMGSYTTPPCAEGVNWYVLKTPVEMSSQQISMVRGLIGSGTARPTQPRNNRIILDANPE